MDCYLVQPGQLTKLLLAMLPARRRLWMSIPIVPRPFGNWLAPYALYGHSYRLQVYVIHVPQMADGTLSSRFVKHWHLLN